MAGRMRTFVAEHLEEQAELLVDRWLDELARRLGVRPSRLLPNDELRDHMPLLLGSMAEALRLPDVRLPNAAVAVLRSVTQLRREQGVSADELLEEFHVLGTIVFRSVTEAAPRSWGDTEPAEVFEACGLLRELLSEVGCLAVGVHREERVHQDQHMSGQLSEFAAMLRHELMGPIGTLKSLARSLGEEEEVEAEERQRIADLLTRRVERIETLAEDLGTLTAAERSRSEERWVPLREVVKRVFGELMDAAERADVRLEVEEPLEEIQVDAARVEIALVNLVSNSIHYADPGKDERWVRVATGSSELAGLTGGWRITVRDNGLGIAKSLHNKVFQRFFRAHPYVADGTGLGLTIAKHVVEQRGGSITFESEQGQGSAFHLDIPQRIPHAGETLEQVGEEAEAPPELKAKAPAAAKEQERGPAYDLPADAGQALEEGRA